MIAVTTTSITPKVLILNHVIYNLIIIFDVTVYVALALTMTVTMTVTLTVTITVKSM